MRFISLLFVLFLASCAVNPATGGASFNFMSEEAEFDLGHDIVAKELERHGLYEENSKLVAYHRGLGEKIVAISDRPDKPYDFLLLDADVFNAAAIPGYVMTYRGILPYMNSEAELAMVMGHEVGHIAARHTARTLSTAALAQVLIAGATIYAAANADSTTAQAAYVLGGAAAVIGMQGFSRSYEREADTLGARYLEALGYPPEHAYNVFKAMDIYRQAEDTAAQRLSGRTPEKTAFYNVLRSHPEPTERMATVERTLGTPHEPAAYYGAAFSNDTIGRDRYLTLIDGLAYGPTPEEGVMGRQVYYNQKGKFTLQIPEGYVFRYFATQENKDNKKGFWRGHNTRLDRLLTLETHTTNKHRSVEEMLRIKNPRVQNILTEKQGDMPFAHGHLLEKHNGKTVGHSVVMLWPLNADELGKATKFILATLTAGDDALKAQNRTKPAENPFAAENFVLANLQKEAKELLKTKQPLTENEAKKLQPLRLKIHTVKAGQTAEKLAEKMALGDLRNETFHALNGLPVGYALKPNQKVKLVIDPNQ